MNAALLLAVIVAGQATAEAPAETKTLTGKVVSIADGDTLTVLDDEKQQHKIRLVGIDCPESKQAFGNKAKEALADKVFGKEVRIEWVEHDRYERVLGKVYLDDRWINKELVAEGMAWHYVYYSDDEDLAAAEKEARAEKLGLWADKDPMPPWDWRREQRAKRQPAQK